MVEMTDRRARERRHHRDEILAAAEVVFAKKGFHACTMEDIAEKAEFSVGTLYNFFPSKEDLYQLLIEQRCEQLCAEVSAAMRGAADPVSAIRMFIDAKIDLAGKYESFVRLYTRERMGDRFRDNELWRETVAPLYKEVRGRLTETFRGGIKAGCFRGDLAPEEMTTALEGLTDGFMYDWLVYPEKVSLREKFEVMVKLFFEGVRSS